MKPNKFTYKLIVNRETFKLYKQKLSLTGYKTINTYPIAIGAQGHETPAGKYNVTAKIKDPSWFVPNAPWAIEAGLVPGTEIPGGVDRNPIKAAFLKVVDDPTGNIGIHGTAAHESLGSAASHGCIRVDPDVALHLYYVIPIGTRVVIL